MKAECIVAISRHKNPEALARVMETLNAFSARSPKDPSLLNIEIFNKLYSYAQNLDDVANALDHLSKADTLTPMLLEPVLLNAILASENPRALALICRILKEAYIFHHGVIGNLELVTL